MLDIVSQHHFVKDFTTRLADKGFVHFRLGAVDERLDMALVGGVEGGTRDGAKMTVEGGSVSYKIPLKD